MPEFEECDTVTLARDRPESSLKKGALGAVVHKFTHPGLAYEVEFKGKSDRDYILLTLTPDEITAYPATASSTTPAKISASAPSCIGPSASPKA